FYSIGTRTEGAPEIPRRNHTYERRARDKVIRKINYNFSNQYFYYKSFDCKKLGRNINSNQIKSKGKMRILLLCLLSLCAAATDGKGLLEAASDGGITSTKEAAGEIEIRTEDTGVDIFAQATKSRDLGIAKDSLEATKEFIEFFNSEIFEKVNGNVTQVAEVVSKVFTFVTSVIDLIQHLQGTESAEMKFLREQFAQVHAKLDSISLQLDDVKRLIEWRTTRVMYANYETFIIAASSILNNYVAAPESSREVLKRQFIAAFQHNPLAPLKLYQAIVEKDFVIAENLAAAVVHYTQNHRRHVINFLLAMQRLIMRGAQLEIAYEKMVHGDGAGNVAKTVWNGRMEKLLIRMMRLENEIKSKYHSQMTSDIGGVILNNRHLSNKDFSGHMYRFLADKFDRRYWIALSYKDVSGGDKHWVSYCGGDARFRTHGGRNVVVASSNPGSSRFTRAKGNAALDAAQRVGSGSHAESWTNLIRSKIGNSCSDAAFVGSICWGCDVWFTMRSDRYVYRKMSNRGDINTVVFG
ncbi:hypothetical protein BOX15_Mlig001364g3, partial [Macrostomum lignano]